MLHLLDPAIAMIDTTAMINTTQNKPQLPLDQVMACTDLEQAAGVVAEIYDFQWHPYFLWMRSLNVDRSAFLQSQLPFRYAVESFSQSLAAVLARVPMLEARITLVENINDESGRGNPLRSHKAKFRQYLQSLGASDVDLEIPATASVFAFNHSILNHCLTQSPECGAAMLGEIEYLYVGISSTIARTIHGCNWVKSNAQSPHYATSEKLDAAYARDLLQIAMPAWKNPHTKPQVAQSLLLGAHYFWSLYEEMQPDL